MKRLLQKIGLFEWYSICSIHQKYNKKCHLCRCGSWHIVGWLSFEKYLWKISPLLWRKWANRKSKKNKFANRFSDKETGEKQNPFPNLK